MNKILQQLVNTLVIRFESMDADNTKLQKKVKNLEETNRRLWKKLNSLDIISKEELSQG